MGKKSNKRVPDLDFVFCALRSGIKNCSLSIETNYDIFKEIVSVLTPNAQIVLLNDSNYKLKVLKIECDILFTNEISHLKYFKFNKHIALQHGFDYIPLGKWATPKTVYIVYNKAYGIDVQKRYNVNYLKPPIPTTYSNMQRQIEFARSQANTNKKIE